MSTVRAIYQSKDNVANEKEFKYTITSSVYNNNQSKASQDMKSLTDTLILMQESINTYLTSKLSVMNEDNNIEDTIGDDDENCDDDNEKTDN
ncbi:hypothetical protein RclHR1_00550030 [Rhizophagus clarus]|uniref:EKC/KEOPS complex subunit GON7 n=1 Tax=Rhizophagus clarus TaxID=94130 RepID=A0A2Z6S025_9GLOM|nr:hypothetical protein RclHR1_00550030 [Rhizophagus clarus]GES80219.1 hypothetical protein RCL_jg7316.t1 [Rhizophagus clarus]